MCKLYLGLPSGAYFFVFCFSDVSLKSGILMLSRIHLTTLLLLNNTESQIFLLLQTYTAELQTSQRLTAQLCSHRQADLFSGGGFLPEIY
jgi:hypothetical protein